ncbi:MAG: SDR family NAD(P)-dependent oxidoreductase [Lactobacillales bacterium]|jgi:short-subunit dehydrogenase|nr:SDR family NAD(P)-dependent oxidoreductase [Lactobacillales bacterium]
MQTTLKNTPNTRFSAIFITGASSGLGTALASDFAQKGVSLFLCGRNKARLEKTAAICRKKGAKVYLYTFDITNEKQTDAAVKKADKIKPLDLVIANAGISAGSFGKEEGSSSTRAIFQTNIIGVQNTVLSALEIFKPRRHGQIVLISSIAGFKALASCPAYSASKACVRVWGEALRGLYAPKGIKINVVCPGFIKTPLTDANTFYMPFMMSAAKAAGIIKKGIIKNKGLIDFPKIMSLPARFIAILPAFITDPVVKLFPKKEK